MIFLVSQGYSQGEVTERGFHTLSGVKVHTGAKVGVFGGMLNDQDTTYNDGRISLIVGSLENSKTLKGVGALSVCGEKEQHLYGEADIVVDTMILDNNSDMPITFMNNIYVDKTMLFLDGLLYDNILPEESNPRLEYFVQFGDDAEAGLNNYGKPSDDSHVCGVVKKVGIKTFLFPIGNEHYYRPAVLKGVTGDHEVHTAKYYYVENKFDLDHVPADCEIVRNEYWFLESTAEKVYLDISYHEKTSGFDITDYDEHGTLQVAAYDLDLEGNVFMEETFQDRQVAYTDLYAASIDNEVMTNPCEWFGFGFSKAIDGKVPQLLTPDGNGINDLFDIPNIGAYQDNKVVIFNRYGVTVYEQDNYNNTWDGRANRNVSSGSNELLPSGTYYVFFYNEGKLLYKNFIQLIHDQK